MTAPQDDEPPMHPRRRANPAVKRPKAKRKEIDQLLAGCWEQGAWIVLGGNGHFKVYDPQEDGVIPIPNTPSGHRTVANKRSQLRRAGFKL